MGRQRLREGEEDRPPLIAYLALAEMGVQFAETKKVVYAGLEPIVGKSHERIGEYVDAIECYHETTVLLRDKLPYRLTPEGVQLAASAKPIRDSYYSILRNQSFGRPILRLGALNSVYCSFLPSNLRELKGEFDVKLVETVSREEVFQVLYTGAVDIALDWEDGGEPHPARNDASLTTHSVGDYCPMVPVVSPELDGEFHNKSFKSVEEARGGFDWLIVDDTEAEALSRAGQLPKGRLLLFQKMITGLYLVQRKLGVGLIWNVGDLLAGLSAARFEKSVRPSIRLIAFWRTEALSVRRSSKLDPMVAFLDTIGYRQPAESPQASSPPPAPNRRRRRG